MSRDRTQPKLAAHRVVLATLLAAPLTAITLTALTACVDDAAGTTSDETEGGDGDGDPSTGEGDGDPSTGDGDGDPSTGDGDGDGDGDKPELGATPNVLCEASLANLALIVAENDGPNPDPLTIEAAYVDTGLQEFVQLAGAVLGRVEAGLLLDDAAILASIDAAVSVGDPKDMLDVEWRIQFVMHQYLRHEISEVASTLPDPANDPALLYARWDAGYCYWDGGLRPLAQLADAVGLPGDSIEADIEAAFERGHAGIEGVEPWAIDEWELPPAKQQAEKSTYAFAHRLVMQWSADAAAEPDPDRASEIAREAYGAFQLIEDRVATKNTPAIAYIEDALLGDPAAIDPDEILDQMNIAFARRARTYTDAALPGVEDLMGTPGGVADTTEGATYARLVEPFMLELDGFDAALSRQTWATWIEAVESDDLVAGEPAAMLLTDWNCALQTSLGLAECSNTE